MLSSYLIIVEDDKECCSVFVAYIFEPKDEKMYLNFLCLSFIVSGSTEAYWGWNFFRLKDTIACEGYNTEAINKTEAIVKIKQYDY